MNVEFCEHDWPGTGCKECREEREAADRAMIDQKTIDHVGRESFAEALKIIEGLAESYSAIFTAHKDPGIWYSSAMEFIARHQEAPAPAPNVAGQKELLLRARGAVAQYNATHKSNGGLRHLSDLLTDLDTAIAATHPQTKEDAYDPQKLAADHMFAAGLSREKAEAIALTLSRTIGFAARGPSSGTESKVQGYVKPSGESFGYAWKTCAKSDPGARAFYFDPPFDSNREGENR